MTLNILEIFYVIGFIITVVGLMAIGAVASDVRSMNYNYSGYSYSYSGRLLAS